VVHHPALLLDLVGCRARANFQRCSRAW
jgi:hypothetical protein